MSELPHDFARRLREAVGAERVLTDAPSLAAYAWDNTGFPYRPRAVVLAESQGHVEAVLALCHAHGVAVTPRGAGTGNVGGCLPVAGGVVLSTQRLNRILEINPADRLAVVEPGVVNADLQAALAEHGLFWPPDPSSARSCTVGGNVAMCAAGPGAVRWGVTRDWVLGLTAVLPGGEVIRTGGRTTKRAVGYDLTRLLVGSEGTLAVVTRAILKLAPLPEARRLLRAVFASVADATRAVSHLMAHGEPPSAMEFLDPASLDLLRRTGAASVPEGGRAMLLLEVAGAGVEIDRLAREMSERVACFLPLELAGDDGPGGASAVWSARAALSPALKKLAPRRVNEDVVVPVSRLPDLIAGLEEIAQEFAVTIVNFGHAGNGNIHVNLLLDPQEPAWKEKLEPVLGRVFQLVLDLDGALSGEHGVGIQKRPYLAWEMDETTIDLQRRIKTLFDPKGVLNPGKLFPFQGSGSRDQVSG